MAAQVTAAGSSTNTPGSTTLVNQPYTSAKDSEYKKKYGLPGSNGWQVLQTTPKQASKLHIGMTFFASCMAAAFFYLLLSHITPNAQASLLPPNPWFIAVLVGLGAICCSRSYISQLGQFVEHTRDYQSSLHRIDERTYSFGHRRYSLAKCVRGWDCSTISLDIDDTDYSSRSNHRLLTFN